MQNKGAEVSIAIPKAKKPVKYERVSPGVYRGSNGDLKRSAFNPTQVESPFKGIDPNQKPKPGMPVSNGTPKEAIDAARRGIEDGLGRGSAQPRFMPGNVADIAGRLAGELGAQPNGKPVPGGIADSVKQPGLADIIARGAKPLPNRGGGSLESNLQRLVDMFNKGNLPSGRPVPKRPTNNIGSGFDIDPGYAVDPGLFDGSLYERARAAATPQIPRSGGSIADLLRRR